MDYSKWTMDQLQARFIESGAAFTVLANERQALLVEMDARKKMSSARARLSALSDIEKDAMRQILNADAVAEEAGDFVVVKS